MKNEIKQFAFSQGAQLVAMARVEAYADYLAEIEKRYQDTGAEWKDWHGSILGNSSTGFTMLLKS